MRYGLDSFLQIKDVSCGDFVLHLSMFESFDLTVNHLLAQLSSEGLMDIPVESAPYFGTLWPAADILMASMLDRLKVKPIASALELGCGLGLPSIVAAKSGLRVTAVDVNLDALSLLQKNCDLNGVRDGLSSVAGDWRTLKLNKDFDLVLASDVLYESYHAQTLARVIDAHLAPSGEFLVVDPCRWHYQEFERCMRDLGLDVDCHIIERNDENGKGRYALISGRRR